MSKIVLIEPRPTAFHVYSAFRIPRLGLPLLGAILQQEGHEVSVYIQSKDSVPLQALRDADVVGVSTTTSTSHEAYKIARLARGMGKPVMLGGSHVTFMPEEGLLHAEVIVHGEAEASTPRVVNALLNRKPMDDIPGVSFMRDSAMVSTGPPIVPHDLTALPFPDFTLVRGRRRMSSIPVQTSRGCPYHCTFCSVTAMFGHRYRFRSEESVLEELCRYQGARVFFCDDNFTAFPARSKRLLQSMLERGIRPKAWSAQTRVDIARDEELLQLMRATGCHRVYIGFESVNPETLKAFNKRQDVEDIRHSIHQLHRHHIRVHGMFVLGADQDGPGTVGETTHFARQMNIDSVQLLALTPLPGTGTMREFSSQGRLLTRDWRYFDGHHVVFETAGDAAGSLQASLLDAMTRFYSFTNAARCALRWDWTNCLIRLLGQRLVKKARKHHRDFSMALTHGHFSRAQEEKGAGLVFDVTTLKKKFLNRGKDPTVPPPVVSQCDELKSRSAFFRLAGTMDQVHARRVTALMRKAARKGKIHLILSLEQAAANPAALQTLARRLARFGKRYRCVSVLGLGVTGQETMLATIKTVPCFEFFDSEAAFTAGTSL